MSHCTFVGLPPAEELRTECARADAPPFPFGLLHQLVTLPPCVPPSPPLLRSRGGVDQPFQQCCRCCAPLLVGLPLPLVLCLPLPLALALGLAARLAPAIVLACSLASSSSFLPQSLPYFLLWDATRLPGGRCRPEFTNFPGVRGGSGGRFGDRRTGPTRPSGPRRRLPGSPGGRSGKGFDGR